MLSIVSVDNNNNKENNLNHSYSTNNITFSKNKIKDFNNNSNISNFNNDVVNEENESKSLPKISQFKKAIIEEGKYKILNSPFEEQLINEAVEKDKPKM